MNLFFFGTLMDDDVRTIVCGGELPVEAAVLAGFRRVHVAGRHYPMLLPHRPGKVAGALARDVDSEYVRRLQIYEGWEYELRAFTVTTADGPVQAEVFMCPADIKPQEPEWRLDRWVLRHKRGFLPQLRRQMAAALAEKKPRGKADRMWPGA